MSKIRLCLLLLSICFTGQAMATCPLLDVVKYEGETYPLAKYTSPPWNRKIGDWVRALPGCSAPGQGRAGYQIEGNRVFLVEFWGCGSKLSVADAYEIPESKVLATWADGKIDVARGRCHGGWDPAKESFIVKEGVLVEFVKLP